MKYQWLLFDLDGTLFDYDTAEYSALNNTFQKNEILFKHEYLAKYRQINAQIWNEFESGKITQEEIKSERFRILANVLDLSFDPLEFSRQYLKYLSQSDHLIKGSEDLLKALSPEYQMALITNGLKDVQRPRVSRSPLKKYFEEVIISEEIGYAKPDPRFFDITFGRINSPEKQVVLIIGDSLSSDMKGGLNYGVDTCWYNPDGVENDPETPVNYNIRKLDQIMTILNTKSTDNINT